MAENLLQAPKLTVEMQESALYRTLGMGLTDTIFLLGHADGLPLNEPHQVLNMQEAVRVLNADAQSPLLRGLMEAYYGGARDLWVVAVAPMSEYEPDLDLRDAAYYLQYQTRLDETYSMLERYDFAQITVPIDAPFNSSVDFLGPLVRYCYNALKVSGDIHLGILGTRGSILQADIDAMVADARLTAIDLKDMAGRPSDIGEASKFVGVFVGDAVFNLKEMPMNHTSSIATVAAATMSQMSLDRGITNIVLPNAVTPSGPLLTKDQIATLSEAKLNPIGRTPRGRRGQPFQTIVHSDNTLAAVGSDYWSFVQMRLVTAVSSGIRSLGNIAKLNGVTFGLFRQRVADYLDGLMDENVLREYELDIVRSTEDIYTVLVDVVLTPYFGIRGVHTTIEVGPLQG